MPEFRHPGADFYCDKVAHQPDGLRAVAGDGGFQRRQVDAVAGAQEVGQAVLVGGLDRRDLGLGLMPARLGPATNPRLATPEALAARPVQAALASAGTFTVTLSAG